MYASQTSHRGNSYLALNEGFQVSTCKCRACYCVDSGRWCSYGSDPGCNAKLCFNPDTNPTTIAAADVGTIASNKLANPSISMLPTGGDDDDEDKEGDDD